MTQEGKQSVLHRIQGIAGSGRDLQDILERTVRALHDGREYAWAGVYLRDGDQVVRRAFCGPVPPSPAVAPGKGSVGAVAQAGILRVVHEVPDDESGATCLPGAKSECAAPILGGDVVLGVLVAESDQPGFFTLEDQSLLQEAAALLSGTILRLELDGEGLGVDTRGWEEDDEGDIGDEEVVEDGEEEE